MMESLPFCSFKEIPVAVPCIREIFNVTQHKITTPPKSEVFQLLWKNALIDYSAFHQSLWKLWENEQEFLRWRRKSASGVSLYVTIKGQGRLTFWSSVRIWCFAWGHFLLLRPRFHFCWRSLMMWRPVDVLGFFFHAGETVTVCSCA